MSRSLRIFFFSSVILLLFFLSVSAHSGHHDDDDGDSDADTAEGGAGGDDAHHPNLRARSLILAKVWCLIVIFVATFVAGVSPYVMKWSEGFLVLGTQFAGGVFLGTAMMHFLSDANETFGDLTEKEYPFAFMLACAGYLIVLLADCVIFSIMEKPRDKVDVEDQVSGVEMGKGVTSQSQYQGVAGTDRNLSNPARASTSSHEDTKHIYVLYTYVFIIALCSHSVFEGLAIGVAKTKADAWKALWTICLHKIFAAIAMGIALLRIIPNRPLLSCTAYSFAFAISSPIGVGIGILIDSTTEGRVADWIFAISMGLACGVFIYVSINHLFAKGYVPHKPTKVDSPYWKFFAVLLGIGVIAVVMIWDT